MTAVITGWSPRGFEEYGSRFVETFHRHWPADVSLIAYTEEHVALPRGECRSLWDCAGARDFYERHKDNPVHTGREVNPKWGRKDRRRPYAWRFDSVKWFRQCMIPAAAAAALPDGEVMAWLDADVVTFADVPPAFVEGLLGDADLVYLGRRAMHSEIGFWAVRLNERTRLFVKLFADAYRLDEVFALDEWHSAFVFDHVRSRGVPNLQVKDLTPGRRGHVWLESPLVAYTDHLKGARKALGRSPERPQ